MSRDFDWPEFLFLLGALRWTIVLSLIAFVGGGIGGLVLAIARTSSHAILRWIAARHSLLVPSLVADARPGTPGDSAGQMAAPVAVAESGAGTAYG